MTMKILPILPVFLAVTALGQGTAMHEAGHTATSVTETGCVLSTASNGQTITVQGKVRSEPHDMGFDIPGCKETVLLTFAGDQDNKVSGAELRRDGELTRFQKYTSSVYKSTGKNICMDCPKYGDVEAELTGKLEIATVPPGATRDPSGLLRDQSGKFIGTSGWGHPSPFARYRLVILSVAHVKARKLPPPNP
jgi:hypothetical protein